MKRLLAIALVMALATQLYAGKRALMWFDGEANFRRFSNTDSIDYYLNKVHDIGFTDVVIDVRPITGEVLFDGTAINGKTSIIWDIS